MIRRWTCPVPWQHLEVGHANEAYLCCHVPRSVGNLSALSPAEVWNGRAAQEIRQSILDGTYEYCRASTCPALDQPVESTGRQPWEVTLALQDVPGPSPVADGPWRVSIANDRACNLCCPSCRDSRQTDPSPGSAEVWEKLRPLVKTARRLKVCGSGEWVMNPRLVTFVQECLRDNHHLRLEILSNLTLFGPDQIRELGLVGRICSVWGSVDAATPETYAKTRGGNFSTVARHATELSELRRQNPFDLTLGFVVSAPNYHEMPDFAEWAGRLGARAEFLRIQDWGHLPKDLFQSLDVGSPEHPLHAHLLEILAHPSLGRSHVRLGDLLKMRRNPR